MRKLRKIILLIVFLNLLFSCSNKITSLETTPNNSYYSTPSLKGEVEVPNLFNPNNSIYVIINEEIKGYVSYDLQWYVGGLDKDKKYDVIFKNTNNEDCIYGTIKDCTASKTPEILKTTLTRRTRICGNIKDIYGKPVPYCDVELITPEGTITSIATENGYYKLDFVPDFENAVLSYKADNYPTSTSESFSIKANQSRPNTITKDFTMPLYTGSIKGTVTYDKSPLEQKPTLFTIVCTSNKNGQTYETKTDENGNYNIENIPIGPYHVYIKDSTGYEIISPDFFSKITIEKDKDSNVDILLKTIKPKLEIKPGTPCDQFGVYTLDGVKILIQDIDNIFNYEYTFGPNEYGLLIDIWKGEYILTASKEGLTTVTETITIDDINGFYEFYPILYDL